MTRRRASGAEEGRYAYEGLDRALHEKARLSILVSLSTRPDGLLFGELKELCALTDGNLSRHLDVLRAEKLVEVWKGFSGRRPQTLVRLTAEGRARFVKYLGELQKLLEDTRRAQEAAEEAHGTKRPARPGLDLSFRPA